MTAPTTTQTLPPRSEIHDQDRWNRESVFPALADFDSALAAVTDRIAEITAYQGRLSENPQTLADALTLLDDLYVQARKAFMYGLMEQSVDTADQQAAGLSARGGAMYGRFAAATSFIEPEILAIDRSTLD